MGTNLSGASLETANLIGAILSEVNVNKANLNGVDMNEAFLQDVENLTLEQLVSTKNYQTATLSPELQKELKELRAKWGAKNKS